MPFQIGWTGDNGDPDNFFATLFSCSAIGVSNYATWCNKEFEDLIQKAKTTPDQAERTKLYEQAQVVFKAEEPAMTLAHSKVFMPMRKRVAGLRHEPAGQPPLRQRRRHRLTWTGRRRSNRRRPLCDRCFRFLLTKTRADRADLHRHHDLRLRVHPPAARRPDSGHGRRARRHAGTLRPAARAIRLRPADLAAISQLSLAA